MVLNLPLPALVAQEETISALKAQYVRPDDVPYLNENPYSPERHRLGEALFFDPRLSGSNAMSCSSCHNPSFAWGDGLDKGIGQGHKPLDRRTPTILNLAWTDKMMWDGRFSQLEGQALGPIGNEAEMHQDLAQLAEKIKGIPGYAQLFEKAYPGEKVTNEGIAKAIAIYERGLVSDKAPFDLWIAGDEDALTEDAVKGFALFNAKARCALCHSGWRFTDDSFHDIGLTSDDIGRGKYLKLKSQQFAFKVPTLRNAVERAPYMHDGSQKNLRTVVEFYDRGGDVKRESLSGLMRPLNLTAAEKKQLLEFLKSLSSNDKPVVFPKLPR